MHYCGVFPLGVQNISFVQSEKGNFTFVKSIKKCKEQLRKGKENRRYILQKNYECIVLLQIIICYFSIKENCKKTLKRLNQLLLKIMNAKRSQIAHQCQSVGSH